jgi:membrane peptidoglycan carboxypeptidase
MFINGLTTELAIALTKADCKYYPNKLSDKAERVQEIVHRNFGCERVAVANLMSIILEEPIVAEREESYPGIGVAVVFTENPNSHSYSCGEVHIATGSSGAIRKDGEEGNQAPYAYPKAWRYATEEEIRAAFEKEEEDE